MTANIKVTDVRIVNLRTVRQVGEIEPAWSPGRKTSFNVGGGSFTEVQTDAGITGIGPGMHPMLLDDVKEYLIGKNAFAVEDHAVALNYYVTALPYQGVSGVDMALWDIIGKAANLPLYKLWGGNKEKIIPYASMVVLSSPEERVDQAVSLKEQGWKAMKLRLHYETLSEDIHLVESVRNAVGPDFTIMVDANQAQSNGNWQAGVIWDYKRAYETAVELQELDIFWLEEPLARYNFDALARLNAEVEIRIAGGENNSGIHEFVQMCQMDTYKLLQPESMVMNGITNLRKIGNLAELYNKELVPHHGGGNIGVIAHQHLIASWRHAPFMELLHDPPIGDYRHKFSIMLNAPQVDEDGYMPLPTMPGIGVEIDTDLIIK